MSDIGLPGRDVLALAALTWLVFVPGGVFWSGVLAGCLIESATAIVLLLHNPTIPTLTQLIGGAEAEPVFGLSGARGGGAPLRPGGE